MNPFKKYPHLFANGKFKVAVNSPTDYKIYRYASYDGITGIIKGEVIGEHGYDRKELPFEKCSLVARPIKDMASEEFDELIVHEKPVCRSSSNEWWVQMESEYSQDFLYLLSIGVYPFDQSHFKDGILLDSSKIST